LTGLRRLDLASFVADRPAARTGALGQVLWHKGPGDWREAALVGRREARLKRRTVLAVALVPPLDPAAPPVGEVIE
jgi:hypothetical protein